ncbi:PspC domain-containing protein [Myxococcota bacterium]|jgi:phage shock protein C|nr:PspC domain-containing protein [Myxococcota bacterium]
MSGEKKLVRSRQNKMIAGVCGGVGAYLGVDPTLVRVAVVLLSFFGPGALAYILVWVLVPEEQG